MKENCAECRHHDVFWGGSGCNLLNNGERCKFEPLPGAYGGRRMTKKAVLISIRPKWCEMIVSRKKTVEVRKTRPRQEPPFKCYVYCTMPKREYDDFISFVTEEGAVGFFGGGKVIGEFTCQEIEDFDSAGSEWAYAVAPRDIPCTMPMHEATALRIMTEKGCLTCEDIEAYFGDEDYEACFWHITDFVVYDTPKDLSEFSGLRQTKFGLEPVSLKRPPQSWCYVEDLDDEIANKERT